MRLSRLCASLAVLALSVPQANAHDSRHQLADTAVLPQERLTVSNIPVTDTSDRTLGFVERFGSAGTLILSFTYTGCETLCPVTNAILGEVDRQMADSAPLTIVSVSIDPVHDTPEALRRMSADLGASANWVWLTAAPRENRMLLGELGVDVAALEAHDPVFLVGDLCSGRFTRVIGVPDPAALIDIARHHPKCDD